jgi:parallel beta-helix repeat protein
VFSDYNFVAGNYIGTGSSGEIAMGNQGWWAVRVLGTHNTIQSNIIANSQSGVLLNVSSHNTVRRNSIHANGGKGILYTAANVSIAAPVIMKIDSTTVSGTACPGCEVEIFSDSQDEGRVFEGSVVASASGSFTLTMQRRLIGPNVTATATDSQGSTSEFSVPRVAPPPPPRRRAVRP